MKNKKHILKIAALLISLGILAVLLKSSSDTQYVQSYNPLSPTEEKFSLLEDLLPPDSNFIAVADTRRLSNSPDFVRFFTSSLTDDGGLKTIFSLLSLQSQIGMTAVAFNLDLPEPAPLIIVQGDFNPTNIIGQVTTEVSKQGSTLSSSKAGGVNLYWQETEEPPFAIAFPDRYHLLIGLKEKLMELFSKRTKCALQLPTPTSPLFGALNTSDRLKKTLPPQLPPVELTQFTSDEQMHIHISMECIDDIQANNLMVFLSGMKALYMYQSGGDNDLLNALSSISLNSDGKTVRADLPIEQLAVLLGKQ